MTKKSSRNTVCKSVSEVSFYQKNPWSEIFLKIVTMVTLNYFFEFFGIFVIFEKMRYFCKIFDHCAPYVVAVSFDIYYGLVCVFYP